MREDGRKFRVMAAKKQVRTDRTLHVVFPEESFRNMTASFDDDEKRGREGYAVAICGQKAGADKRSVTYMARSIDIPGKGDLISQSSVSVTPSGDFMESVLAAAARRQGIVLEIHTHPGSADPVFSSVDIDHGLDNGRFLRSCHTRFCMMVIGAEGFSVMEYNGESDSLQLPRAAAISLMGRQGLRQILPAAETLCDGPSPEAVDRQVRIWGARCQRRIEATIAGIVGLGGTGAALLQMLALIGVKKFVLCDPDDIEPSNLSRLPYACATDAGKKKTRAAAGYLRKTARDVEVETVNDRVQDAKEALRACDVLFGCVDNDGARLSMNEVALKYFIPYIDTGTEIFVENGKVRDMGGQVRIVVPSVTGCLECAGAIDRTEAAASLVSGEEHAVREAAGYVRGTADTPAPAVITLNTIIASMAAQEFVDMIACRDRENAPNYLLYDATRPQIERFLFERSPDCPMCGRDGILGAGDPKRHGRPGVKKIRSPG
ncbi:MAG: putative adenylyltransferase [Methanocella sp. PtaU1.Bin125]|nr:MAG: putative adenylyltransferase [Methanocella sp. PtaU1.Bin125]